MTATAEDWVRRIEEVLDKFNLSKEKCANNNLK